MYDTFIEKEIKELYFTNDITKIKLTEEQKKIIKTLKDKNKDISNDDILKILKNEDRKHLEESEKEKYFINKVEKISSSSEDDKFIIDFIKSVFMGGNIYSKDIIQLINDKNIIVYEAIYYLFNDRNFLVYAHDNFEDDKKIYDYIVNIINNIFDNKKVIEDKIKNTEDKLKRLTLDKENLIKEYSINKDDKTFGTNINLIDKEIKINKEIIKYYESLDIDQTEINKNIEDPRFKIVGKGYKDKYFVILRREGLYISSIYNIEKNVFLDKDDTNKKNIIYPYIVENKIDIEEQLEKYLRKSDNIYASLYLNKKELRHCNKKDVVKYINMIKNINNYTTYDDVKKMDIPTTLDISKYTNNVEESICLNNINNIKVYFDDDNLITDPQQNKEYLAPIFKYNNKDIITYEDMDCLDDYEFNKNYKHTENVDNGENLENLKSGTRVPLVKKKGEVIDKKQDEKSDGYCSSSDSGDSIYSSSDSGDSLYSSDNETKEHVYDEFKCFKCKNIPKDKTIKTILYNNNYKTIYFCNIECFENEDKCFRK